MIEKIIAELETLLAANPEVEIKDSAGVIVARKVDQSIRHKAIKDCVNIVKKVISDGI